MTSLVMNNELEETCKLAAETSLGYYPCTCLVGIGGKISTNHSRVGVPAETWTGAIRHPQNSLSTKVKRTKDYNNTSNVHTTWRRVRLTTAAMEKRVVFKHCGWVFTKYSIPCFFKFNCLSTKRTMFIHYIYFLYFSYLFRCHVHHHHGELRGLEL